MERMNGRPADACCRLDKEQRCYDLLDRLGVDYQRVDHAHADTIAACADIEQVLGAKICKNLFFVQQTENGVLSAADARRSAV